MAMEIEYKFLVSGDEWREGISGHEYLQGYMPMAPGRSVRIRIIGETGFLTIKGGRNGIARIEFEYEIPCSDARQMLEAFCVRPFIEKTRYKRAFKGFTWEIDVFSGDNSGLILAEIELEYEGQRFEKPPWAGKDVSADPRYFNSNLARNPYRTWKDSL